MPIGGEYRINAGIQSYDILASAGDGYFVIGGSLIFMGKKVFRGQKTV